MSPKLKIPTVDVRITVPEYLLLVRRRADLTVSEASKVFGVKQAVYKAWEAGEDLQTLPNPKVICAVLFPHEKEKEQRSTIDAPALYNRALVEQAPNGPAINKLLDRIESSPEGTLRGRMIRRYVEHALSEFAEDTPTDVDT